MRQNGKTDPFPPELWDALRADPEALELLAKLAKLIARRSRLNKISRRTIQSK